METLYFEPNKAFSGELWRIITGQFLHSNNAHMWMNIAGLALVWALHGDHYRIHHFWVLSIAGMLLVGLLVTLFSEYGIYTGFSGVLHFLLAYGAMIDIKNKDKTGYLLIIGLIAKVAYENIFGAAQSTEQLIDASVAVDAHAFGLVTGFLLFIVIKSLYI
nr:rhombosortase [Psychrosphaera haliotis]